MHKHRTREEWETFVAGLKSEWDKLSPEEQAAQLALCKEVHDEVVEDESNVPR